MAQGDTVLKLSSEQLRACGLEIMKRLGMPLRRVAQERPQQIYAGENGRRIRIRTSNDRCLTTKANSTDPSVAVLDIQGTDDLLLVMPLERRGRGRVEAYLVPTRLAEKAVTGAHGVWLAGGPSTAGSNRTYTIWFDRGVAESGDFARKWESYRLPLTLNAETVAGQG